MGVITAQRHAHKHTNTHRHRLLLLLLKLLVLGPDDKVGGNQREEDRAEGEAGVMLEDALMRQRRTKVEGHKEQRDFLTTYQK